MNFKFLKKFHIKVPKKLQPLVFSVSTIIFVIILSQFSFINSIDNKIYDSFLWFRYKKSLNTENWKIKKNLIDSNIVVIKIDHKSLNYMSSRVGDFPWPRSIYGDVVNKLKKEDVNSIFFDIQFSERQLTSKEKLEKILNKKFNYSNRKANFLSNQVFTDFSTIKESFLYNEKQLKKINVDVDDVISALNIVYNNNDVYFIRSVRDAKNVFLPFLSLKSGNFKYNRETLNKILTNSIKVNITNDGIRAWTKTFKLPIPSLVKYSYSTSNVSYITFRNEINRDVPVVVKFNGHFFPHIDLSLKNHFSGDSLNNFKINFTKGDKTGKVEIENQKIKMNIDSLGRTLISFRGEENDFNTISFSDFIYPENDSTEKFNKNLLKGKIILIGATAPILRDVIETPLGLMPGIIFHANFLNNLLKNDFIVKLSKIFSFGLLFLMFILLSNIYFYHSNNFLDLIVFLLSIIGTLIIIYFLFDYYSIYIPPFLYFTGLTIIFVSTSSAKLITAKKEKSGILKTFEKYVSSNIVKELLDNPDKIKLGGELRNISILFSDIRSFTSFSENRPPEEVIDRLNHFFTEMTDVIYDSNGTLDKYVGDEIMALFGAPVSFEDHKYKACLAAANMIIKLNELTDTWNKNDIEPFQIGIGINSGNVIVGNIGSSKIMDYTVIGDSVNLAARVEALTRNYDSSVLITEFTYEGIEHLIEVEFLDSVIVKGKKKAVKIYKLISVLTVNGNKIKID